MSKVLLIELSDSHSEVFRPVRNYLSEAGFETDCFVTEKYPIENNGLIKRVAYGSRIHQLAELNRYIHAHRYENLFFNTAEGLSVRDFCYLNHFRNLNICGVLHQAKKLKGSYTQKVISSKIKNYFVLAEYIKDYACGLNNKIELEYFYPLSPYSGERHTEKLIITVPGEIALWRRDYVWLIEFIKNNIGNIRNKFYFIFLGSADNPDGKKVTGYIKENNLNEVIKFYDSYISENEFDKVISSSALIFPLLNPGVGEYDSYRRTKISGAFNLSFNYRIPMLMNNDFRDAKDFQNISFFYDKQNFTDVLNSINEESIKLLADNFEKDVRFSYDYQSNKFRKFVNKIFK